MNKDEIKSAVSAMQRGASVKLITTSAQSGTFKLIGLSTKKDNDVVRVQYTDGTYGNIYLTDITSVTEA
jgi:TusA-related sulfurtransferase